MLDNQVGNFQNFERTSNAVKRMHELLIINNDIKVPSINSIEIKCQNNQNDW